MTSKIEQMRALREQRYAERTGQAKPPAPEAKKVVAAEALAQAEAPTPEPGELCGHQGIDGRRCIREMNHANKYHKYKKPTDG